jgi:hypothetical protein
MIIEIDVKEKWEIGESLTPAGTLYFGPLDEHEFSFSGEWTTYHPTNPQLRAAVEKQWEKLRPLADDECWGNLGRRIKLRMCRGEVEWSPEENGKFSRWYPVTSQCCEQICTAAEAFKARELAKREAAWKVEWSPGQECALIIGPKIIETFTYLGGEWSQSAKDCIPVSVRRRSEELWERKRPLAGNEIRSLSGAVLELYRTEQDGDESLVYAKRSQNIHIFQVGVSDFEYFEPGTEEKVRVYYEANRPLKSNEWRGPVGGKEILASFKWIENEAVAFAGVSPLTAWSERQDRALHRDYDQVHAALRAWACKPENLPHHIAIVDGRPYVMKDDEFRLCGGEVSKCRVVIGTLVNAAPGQRERVEKWRTSHASKPLGENELERLGGTRSAYDSAGVHPDGMPFIVNRISGARTWGWYLNGGFSEMTHGSVDRAKRIFARLYKFRDDEGVDAQTGKLRTMAINEARHPETGEIVRLRVIDSVPRRFGCSEFSCSILDTYSLTPEHARCIAYRDHVLKLEKELEALK